MKNVENLKYQFDVVTTLVDNYKERYILWIDTEDRMIETINGINRQVTDWYEIVKNCNLFGYIAEVINTK